MTRQVSQSMLLALAVSITAIAGCGSDDRAESGEFVLGSDTAGAEIVETAPPAEGELVAWEVDAQPALRIGAGEGEPWEMLYDVRVARTLPDGRIAVSNVGSAQVFIYDADGRFLQAIGGRGDGPGEFHAPEGIYVFSGDSLLIHDVMARSFSVFTLQGEFVRRFQRVIPAGVSSSVLSLEAGALDDGSVIIAGGLPRQPDAAPLRLYDLDVLPRMGRVYRLGADGSIAKEYGDALMRASETAGGIIVDGPVADFVTTADGFHLGLGIRYEIHTYDASGRLRRILRHAAPPRPVTDAMIASYNEARGLDPKAQAAMAGRMGTEHFPPVLRPHGQIRTAASGGLWVQRAELFPATPRVWDVFSRTGAYEGMVQLPDRFMLTEIGGDHVLGVWKDEHDVEYVVRYPLRRGSPPADLGPTSSNASSPNWHRQ